MKQTILAIMTLMLLSGSSATDILGIQFDEPLDENCHYEDQTGGMGGQSGNCGFQCRAGGELTVTAQADDEDAHVTGNLNCGGGHARCTGDGADKNQCSTTVKGKREGIGTCKGDSDETIDSGFYVSCSWDKNVVDHAKTTLVLARLRRQIIGALLSSSQILHTLQFASTH